MLSLCEAHFLCLPFFLQGTIRMNGWGNYPSPTFVKLSDDFSSCQKKNSFKHGLQLKNQEIMKIQQSLEYCTFLFLCRYWQKSWTPIEINWFAHQLNYHWTLPHKATQTGTSHLQNPSWPLDQPMDEPYGLHLWEHRKGSDLCTVKSNYNGLSKDQNIFPLQARLMKQWK